MALRPPSLPFQRFRPVAGDSALEAELAGEKAAALGRLARAMERSLARLSATPPGTPGRDAAVRAAAEDVWLFLVQREVCGFTDQGPVIEHYGVPAEVMARVGERRGD